MSYYNSQSHCGLSMVVEYIFAPSRAMIFQFTRNIQGLSPSSRCNFRINPTRNICKFPPPNKLAGLTSPPIPFLTCIPLIQSYHPVLFSQPKLSYQYLFRVDSSTMRQFRCFLVHFCPFADAFPSAVWE